VETIRTTGDIQDAPLSQIGGKGLFTREIDEALLDGKIDLAVHSLKDLPTDLPEGLALGAIPIREDPRDVLIARQGGAVSLDLLPAGGRVGTSSLRRAAFLRMHRRDLVVSEIRGNLDTRIRKVDEGDFDAVVLAAAGVRRLGWSARVTEFLPFESWLPAPGQGALAVVVRSADLARLPWLRLLDHPASRSATTAEREVLRILEGGCRLPLAALGLPFGTKLRLKAMVVHPDGSRLVRAEATGEQDEAKALGRKVADLLLTRGAGVLLEESRVNTNGPHLIETLQQIVHLGHGASASRRDPLTTPGI
jgi:hydroxymethylbilane synthase